MIPAASGKIVLSEAAASQLRDEFVAWQCRLRQLSARQMGGRPQGGMSPAIASHSGELLAESVVTVLMEAEPANNIALMRFQYKKTQDPIERYDKILDILQAGYFQHPENFSDTLTALFGPRHPLPARLLHHRYCVLDFEQYRQCYRIPCTIAELAEDDSFHQATYWHNAMFNPDLPAGLRILAFAPDWPHASQWRKEE